MTRRRALIIAVIVALAAGGAVAALASQRSTWKVAWQDEFSGKAGSKPDKHKWGYDLGNLGVNAELESYTNKASNVRLDGHGDLEIVARKQRTAGWDYSSGRILTRGLFATKYGRIEARIQLPYGQGIWPAFWMLGSNIAYVGWPSCGEVDIMENIGREPAINHGTAHGPGYSGADGLGGSVSVPTGKLADAFHVYAIEWSKQQITWSFDGKAYKTLHRGDQPAGAKWAFDHPFFLLLNVAVGGSWPGNPDPTTTFPQTMKVDYVRVYKRT